jgi:Fe-S oxidoreductase
MGSKETLQQAMQLIQSSLGSQMAQAVEELSSMDATLRSGVKSAGAKARKASNEWGKSVTARLKELREAKRLLSQYRKETILESKS